MARTLNSIPEYKKDPCRDLWSEVLRQAIDDYNNRSLINTHKSKVSQKDYYSPARWFTDDRTDIGSFIWVCSVLGLEHSVAREHIMSGEHYRRLHHYASNRKSAIKNPDLAGRG